MTARHFDRPLESVVLALVLVATLTSSSRSAPLTVQQRTQARVAEAALKKAGNLYRSKKFTEAGAALQDAQENLGKLALDDSKEVAALVAPLNKQLARARELLEAEGVQLPPAAPAATEKENPQGASFTRQVAPILVARCSGCHIQRSRGEFNMSTYVALSKGSSNGIVIMPGDAQGSRLVELIASGDMPRSGEKVTREELTLISTWIDAGAKFDGPDSAAPLTSFAAAPKGPDPTASRPKISAAREGDAVQFARDVGPILLANCTECHGEQNPRNNFSVNTFASLLRGGDSGLVVAPGKPDQSLLVKKLRGMMGERMPLGQPPLADEAIAKIEAWIALGARFDGSDATMPLADTIGEVIARRASHDELLRSRAELAARNWRLILPDSQANREETSNVLVYGSASPVLLADVARMADEQFERLRKLFKVPADEPMIKGRLTLFVFEKRYDYGEIGTMLEHREIPTSWRGHWHFDPRDAYGCVLLSPQGQAGAGVVAQQIAGAYVASLGKIPRWFAEGTARAVAAKAEPKDPRVKLWDDSVGRIVQASAKPQGFLTGSLSPEESDILSYGYVKHLMASAPRYASLVSALQQGTPFDDAFARVYGGSPGQLVDGWLARATKRARQ